MAQDVKWHSYRCQRTVARPAEVEGIGYLTGADVRLRFVPAPPDTGVVFVRTDLEPPAHLPARIGNVTGTERRTTLGRAPAQVGLVEHVLAALAGLRIDNCFVEVDAPEPPGLDGSAQQFVSILQRAGAEPQAARRAVWAVRTPVLISRQGASLALHPAEDDRLKVSYFLDYGMGSPIGRQFHSEVITPEHFANHLAPCRTFLLESEAAELRRQGLGTRTTPSDLLVFGPRGPIHNRLRFANEPARHKVLDIIGDLSLLGHDLSGHVVAYRSGHCLNAALVRALNLHLSETCPGLRRAA